MESSLVVAIRAAFAKKRCACSFFQSSCRAQLIIVNVMSRRIIAVVCVAIVVLAVAVAASQPKAGLARKHAAAKTEALVAETQQIDAKLAGEVGIKADCHARSCLAKVDDAAVQGQTLAKMDGPSKGTQTNGQGGDSLLAKTEANANAKLAL